MSSGQLGLQHENVSKKNMVKYNYIKNRAIKWGEEYKENKSRFEILFLDPSTTSKNASVCSKHTHGL